MRRNRRTILGTVLCLSLCLTLPGCTVAESEGVPTPTAAVEVLPTPTPPRELTLAEKLELVRQVRFNDVSPAASYADAVSYVAQRGILAGVGEGNFDPDALLTREQALAVLARLARTLDPATAPAEGEEARWAAGAALFREEDEGGERVTRGQLATWLRQLAEIEGFSTDYSGDLSAWPDGDRVKESDRMGLSWALENGVLGGVVADSICPDIAVSRAQTAAAVTSFLALVEGDEVPRAISDAAALPAFVSASRLNHEEIQSYVDEMARQYGANGVQVAVIEKGHVTDTYASGWAVRNSVPLTADHKERVASISKVAIGMTAVSMAEDGVVDLDGSIGDYWGITVKNPYYPNDPVSINSILTHTSSIALFGDDESRRYDAVRSRLSGSGFSNLQPGAIWSWGYNNYAFAVLGMTLELAGNANMDQLLRSRFFRVMDIDGGFWAGDMEHTDLIVPLYNHDGSVARSVETQQGFHAGAPGATGTFFAGGLVISSRDLGKLVATLANHGEYEGLRMLSPQSVEWMETYADQTVSDGFYQGHPLRYRTNMYGREGLYFHTGSAYGVYNLMSYDPATGDGVVVLTTGASAARDSYGVYAVGGSISEHIYNIIIAN